VVLQGAPSAWHVAHVPESQASPAQQGAEALHAVPSTPQQRSFSHPLPQQSSGLVQRSLDCLHAVGLQEFSMQVNPLQQSLGLRHEPA
jgi:hypothetical protein